MQKSREGLLRHLLYSALLSLPTDNLDLAKHICGSIRLSSHSQRAWSYEELYDMLVRLVSRSKAKFFFLVDALDECDPQDLHGQLANEMMKISQLPNVKLCVSCRPWGLFVSKFRHDRTLRLDKETYEDMELTSTAVWRTRMARTISARSFGPLAEPRGQRNSWLASQMLLKAFFCGLNL